jgi:hypothetical protein
VRISLPNGDELIPDAEFAALLAVTQRTLSSYDGEGCPFAMIGGRKYRPRTEGLTWVASRIKRRNPRRNPEKRAATP